MTTALQFCSTGSVTKLSVFPAFSLFFNPFNIDWCGSLTAPSSFSRIECEPTLCPLQVPRQLKGGGGYANNMVEELYCLNYLQILKISAFVYALPQLLWLPKYIHITVQIVEYNFLFHIYNYYLKILLPIFPHISFLYYLSILISEYSSLTFTPTVQFSPCSVLRVLPCMLAILVCISRFTCCPTSWHRLSESNFVKK